MVSSTSNDVLSSFQNELKQYGMEKVEITSQLAEVAGERNELKASLSELRRSEAAAREEIEQLNGKVKEVSEAVYFLPRIYFHFFNWM